MKQLFERYWWIIPIITLIGIPIVVLHVGFGIIREDDTRLALRFPSIPPQGSVNTGTQLPRASQFRSPAVLGNQTANSQTSANGTPLSAPEGATPAPQSVEYAPKTWSNPMNLEYYTVMPTNISINNPGLEKAIVDATAGKVPSCILEGIVVAEGAYSTYWTDPGACKLNICSAAGPFQMTTGWAPYPNNVYGGTVPKPGTNLIDNCIQCSPHFSSGTRKCPDAWSNNWPKNLGQTNPCDSGPAAVESLSLLQVKARYFAGRSLTNESPESQKGAIIIAADKYYGASTKIPRFNYCSYGEYVYQRCDPTHVCGSFVYPSPSPSRIPTPVLTSTPVATRTPTPTPLPSSLRYTNISSTAIQNRAEFRFSYQGPPNVSYFTIDVSTDPTMTTRSIGFAPAGFSPLVTTSPATWIHYRCGTTFYYWIRSNDINNKSDIQTAYVQCGPPTGGSPTPLPTITKIPTATPLNTPYLSPTKTPTPIQTVTPTRTPTLAPTATPSLKPTPTVTGATPTLVPSTYWTNLTGTFKYPGNATFAWTYTGPSGTPHIDVSTSSDLIENFYPDFAVGSGSPVILTNPTKWTPYACNRVIYWRVRQGSLTSPIRVSKIASNTVSCSTTPTPQAAGQQAVSSNTSSIALLSASLTGDSLSITYSQTVSSPTYVTDTESNVIVMDGPGFTQSNTATTVSKPLSLFLGNLKPGKNIKLCTGNYSLCSNTVSIGSTLGVESAPKVNIPTPQPFAKSPNGKTPAYKPGSILVKLKDKVEPLEVKQPSFLLKTFVAGKPDVDSGNVAYSDLNSSRIPGAIKKLHATHKVKSVVQALKGVGDPYLELVKTKTMFLTEIANKSRKINDAAFLSKDLSKLYVLNMENGTNIPDAVKLLRNDPNIEYVSPDYVLYPAFAPNDSQFNKQWTLRNTGQTGGTPGADINITKAWDQTLGSPGVIIGIVDGGIDYRHPDLGGCLGPGCLVIGGNNSADNSNDLMDYWGHGTAMAGIIAAQNNGQGIVGVCPQCKLLALKSANKDGTIYFSTVITSIQYGVNHGAKVLSASLGAPNAYDQALRDVIVWAKAQGVLLVAAAGNGSIDTTGGETPHYPAAFPESLSVAATDKNDKKASYSSFGTSVDVSAPAGEYSDYQCGWGWKGSTLTTFPNIEAPTSCDLVEAGGLYKAFPGTSTATPHVAGLAGLLFSKYPNWTVDQVVDQIKNTADNIYDKNPGYVGKLGTGRINAEKALGTSTTPTLTPTPTPTPTQTPTPSASVYSNLAATMTAGKPAIFSFAYSDPKATTHYIDVSTLPDMSWNVYLDFGKGSGSPIAAVDKTLTWPEYTCGKTLYWWVRNVDYYQAKSNPSLHSQIKTSIVTCGSPATPTPTPTPQISYYSNLSQNLQPPNTATFTFTYSGPTSTHHVDLSLSPSMEPGTYLDFGTPGTSSPINGKPEALKWPEYACGKTLYWWVRQGNFQDALQNKAPHSEIKPVTMPCGPTKTPTPTATKTPTPTPTVGTSYSSLTATLNGTGASYFNFAYPGASVEHHIDVSLSQSMEPGTYLDFGKGSNSPIVVGDSKKWAEVTCNKQLYWWVRQGNFYDALKNTAPHSEIKPITVTCGPSATPTPGVSFEEVTLHSAVRNNSQQVLTVKYSQSIDQKTYVTAVLPGTKMIVQGIGWQTGPVTDHTISIPLANFLGSNLIDPGNSIAICTGDYSFCSNPVTIGSALGINTTQTEKSRWESPSLLDENAYWATKRLLGAVN